MHRRLVIFSLCFAVLFASFSGMVAQANEGAEEKEVPAGPQYVDIGPITVPVVRDGKIFQYIRLSVKLEAKNGEDAKSISDRIPMLNDAYLSSLYGSFYSSKDMTGPLVDIEKVRTRLSKANQRILPEGLVQNIYIQQLSQNTR